MSDSQDDNDPGGSIAANPYRNGVIIVIKDRDDPSVVARIVLRPEDARGLAFLITTSSFTAEEFDES